MKHWVYQAGRTFQLFGLLALPSAVWVGEIDRDENGAIVIFAGSLGVFLVGYLLVHFSSRM